jgi:hypothetical protein
MEQGSIRPRIQLEIRLEMLQGEMISEPDALHCGPKLRDLTLGRLSQEYAASDLRAVRERRNHRTLWHCSLWLLRGFVRSATAFGAEVVHVVATC